MRPRFNALAGWLLLFVALPVLFLSALLLTKEDRLGIASDDF